MRAHSRWLAVVSVTLLAAVLGFAGCRSSKSAGTSATPDTDPAATANATHATDAGGPGTSEGLRCEAAATCPEGMACVDNRVRCITAPCDAHFYECRTTCSDDAACPEGCTCETGSRATIGEGQARVCDCPEVGEPVPADAGLSPPGAKTPADR